MAPAPDANYDETPVLQNKLNKRPNIAVCIPHKDTIYTRAVVFTLLPLACLSAKEDRWCDLLILTQRGYGIDIQREQLAKMFEGNTQFDYLFFLDSDQMFSNNTPGDALKMLYDMDVPIASGITRRKFDRHWSALLKKSNPNKPHCELFPLAGSRYDVIKAFDKASPIVDVDAVGLYCCLIKREVFQKIPQPWFVWSDSLGEDVSFCEKVTEAGYKITVNSDVQLDHMGILHC